MTVGGSRLPPRPPVTGAPRSAPAARARSAQAPEKIPLAQVSSPPKAPRPASVTPEGLQPSTARPASPKVSLTPPPNGPPSEKDTQLPSQKLSPSKLTTSASAGIKPFDVQSTGTLDHGTQGLDLHAGMGHGKKVVLAGVQTDARVDYKPTSNVQLSAQTHTETNLGSMQAWAAGGVNPATGDVAAKVNAGVTGPHAAGVLTQTTQLGSQVKNELQTVGFATVGGANVSAEGRYNPATGQGAVNAGFSAMGPSAMVATGHTTTLGPLTITNNLIASVGTAGISGNVHASNNNGVLSWGADTQVLAGGGLGWQHSVSLDTNYFKTPPPPPPTALSQAQANQKKYGEPPLSS